MIDSAGEMAFWAKVAALGQVASAAATTAAVIVALWIARSDRRVNLKVTAGLRLIWAGDGSPATDVIAIVIANRGTRLVRVVNLGWRSGWLRRYGPEFLRQQFALQNASLVPGSPRLPFDVEPLKEQTIMVNVSDFNDNARPEDRDLFTRKFPFSDDRRVANVCVLVFPAAAKEIVTKVETSLAHFLATGRIERGAARFNARSRKS
jgi:hypothetical protein